MLINTFKITEKIKQYLLILLGVFIPTSIGLTNVTIALISLLWIIEGNYKIKWENIKKTKWLIPMFTLIALYVLGMFWGETHVNAHFQFQRLSLLLFFPVLTSTFNNQKTIRYSAIAFLITNLISAIIAILINIGIIPHLSEYFSFISKDKHVAAFIKYNYHNVLLSFASILALYVLFKKKTRYRKLLFLVIIVYAISIFTERGRAGQVIFNLTCLFYIIYYNYNKLFRLISLLSFLIFCQYLIYNNSEVYKKKSIERTFNIIKNKGYVNSKKGEKKLDSRFVWSKYCLKKIKERPLLGYGTGSFGALLIKDYDDIFEEKSYEKFLPHMTPHNQYLYVWFELGFFGLLLLLLIFALQIKELLKKKDSFYRLLLPISFMLLLLVDSYFFIFIGTITYIYLYTIFRNHQAS